MSTQVDLQTTNSEVQCQMDKDMVEANEKLREYSNNLMALVEKQAAENGRMHRQIQAHVEVDLEIEKLNRAERDVDTLTQQVGSLKRLLQLAQQERDNVSSERDRLQARLEEKSEMVNKMKTEIELGAKGYLNQITMLEQDKTNCLNAL